MKARPRHRQTEIHVGRTKTVEMGTGLGGGRKGKGCMQPGDSPYTGARTVVESSPQARMKPSAVPHP